MAITFVNKGTWAAGTTSISPGIPASMAAGDLMILTVHTCNQVVSAVSNWTEVTSSPVSTGTANTAGGTRVTTYYRWWQSGDSAPTVNVTSGTVTNGIIMGFRGVDPSTPFDATPVATTLASASTTLTMTGITTATANACIVWSIARDQDLNSTTAVTAYTNANLTGITEVHDQVVNTGVGGGVWVGYGFKGTVGATGNTTITQTSSIAVGLTIALRPQPNDYPLTCNSGSYTYTGASTNISFNRALTASSGSYTYTGSSVDITKGAALNHRSLTADPGSYTYTGQSISIARNRTLGASAGAYAYAGSSAAINRNRVLNASAGSYAYTGSSIDVTVGSALNHRSITAQSGSYAYTGSSVALLRGRSLAASSGSYAYSGSTATILRERSLTALTGAYTYTGSSVSMVRGRVMVGQAGSYSYNGNSISITLTGSAIDYSITALSGAYSITGSSATLLRSRLLDAQAGSYTVNGQSASIMVGRSLYAQAGSYAYTGSMATIACMAPWPNPADVKAGVVYGLSGEFTGTLVVGGGGGPRRALLGMTGR